MRCLMKRYAALVFFVLLAVASHSQKIHPTDEISVPFKFASYSPHPDQKNKPSIDCLTKGKNQRKTAKNAV